MERISTPEAFQAWLDRPDRSEAAIDSLDLRGFPALEVVEIPASLFLNCHLTPLAAANVAKHGSMLVPHTERWPFPLHRPTLYSPEELFDGFDGTAESYFQSYDYRVYQHFKRNGHTVPNIRETLARRLHDHAISSGVVELIKGRKVVAIMGGHSMERRDPRYAQIAHIARDLTLHGYLMTSGGGPGAMEATHLGAWFAHFPPEELDKALLQLAVRPEDAEPGREYADEDWLCRAWAVRERWPVEDMRYQSLGIPTWLYGHEPPAAFATHIAKFFANSIREEGLLAIATHGVVFAPGSAGTIQEIFQDATQNHYGSYGSYSPMILFDRHYWTHNRPVWPLLAKVAQGRVYEELLFLTDSPEAVVRRIRSYRPEIYRA